MGHGNYTNFPVWVRVLWFGIGVGLFIWSIYKRCSQHKTGRNANNVLETMPACPTSVNGKFSVIF